MVTHLGWPSGIGLKLGNVLLLKVSGSILSSANLRGLVYLLQNFFRIDGKIGNF